jgi:hypothetical protein
MAKRCPPKWKFQVVLDGNYITTEIIQIVASNVTVADLTLREAYNHPIHVMSTGSSHTLNARIYNVHITDPGQQAIKINPVAEYNTDYGLIACSHIELTDAEADRAFLRVGLGLPRVDAGDGWLIFRLPPAEVAVHPAEQNASTSSTCSVRTCRRSWRRWQRGRARDMGPAHPPHAAGRWEARRVPAAAPASGEHGRLTGVTHSCACWYLWPAEPAR